MVIFFHNNYSNNSWSSSVVVVGDICSCNDVDRGVKRGHPKRCDVYVECRVRDYPAGVACPMSQCRNSIDGTCSSNCSDSICDEAVPQSKIFTYRYYKCISIFEKGKQLILQFYDLWRERKVKWNWPSLPKFWLNLFFK